MSMFNRHCAGERFTATERLFKGCYPTGIVYADKATERDGDYQRIAYLPYATLAIEWDSRAIHEPREALRELIECDAARMREHAGEAFAYTSSGQTVQLASSWNLNEVLAYLGYRSEPAYLRNGEQRIGRKDVWCGLHRIIESAHASEVWAWLRATYAWGA